MIRLNDLHGIAQPGTNLLPSRPWSGSEVPRPVRSPAGRVVITRPSGPGPAWAAAALLIAAGALRAEGPNPRFVEGVDLKPFELVAVQHAGRYKTFDTLARSAIRNMSYNDVLVRTDPATRAEVRQSAAFTFLDMLFRPQDYRDVRMIYVKESEIRKTLVLAAGNQIDKATQEAIRKDGKVSLSFLSLPEVQTALNAMSANVMTTAKKIDILLDNAGYADPRLLRSLLRIIPPPGAESDKDRWFSLEDLQSSVPRDAAHASLASRALPGFSAESQQELADRWNALGAAWAAQDAPGVNQALAALADRLRQINPRVYPPMGKLSLEHWYYRWNKMMWSWAVYLFAVVFLLMGVVHKWPRAIKAGVIFFGLGFALHTTACGIRWYLAGHIPNSNMFEAVTAAAWLGAAIAIFFELGPSLYANGWAWRIAGAVTPAAFVVWLASIVARGIPVDAWQQWPGVAIAALILFAAGCMALIALVVGQRMASARGLPLLAASTIGMVALMCGQFMKNELSSDIGRPMPVLNDLWLYIHTNMIIASYAIIGMAFVTAALYLVGRLLTMPFEQSLKVWLPILLGAGIIPLPALFPGVTLMTVMPAWTPFLIVMGMWLVGSAVRRVWSESARRARAVWEGEGGILPAVAEVGAMALAGAGPAGAAAPASFSAKSGGAPVGSRRSQGTDQSPRIGLAKVFDGATMLLLELSFIMLWTGIIMGAVWADHSWGRPWGWDPKEVFALNTWIIFLILVHVRLKVVDKELWTAVLAVVGTSVMMFNWVVVNFFIVGLHSYA
ncbi:MAG: hypothetical protein AMXMBFR83_00540 [Phycisphaerae bacterium]